MKVCKIKETKERKKKTESNLNKWLSLSLFFPCELDGFV